MAEAPSGISVLVKIATQHVSGHEIRLHNMTDAKSGTVNQYDDWHNMANMLEYID